MTDKSSYPEHDEVGRLLSSISIKLDALQSQVIGAAGLVGFVRDTINQSQELWSAVGPSARITPEGTQYYGSTVEVLRSLSNELDQAATEAQWVHSKMEAVASAGSVVASGMNALAAMSGFSNATFTVYSPYDKYRQHAEYESRLAAIDPTLGKAYGELIEVIHTTRKDPTRPAMFLARQLFDHLFDRISPDAEVRSSRFWRVKTAAESEDPNAVWRAEKVEIACFTKVRDPVRAQTLGAVSRQTLDLYNLLNKAHKRGPVPEDESSRAVEAMIRVIQQWTDATQL